ncbi:MAG: DUF4258 domain-containing protein [Actinomycetota bacterium]
MRFTRHALNEMRSRRLTRGDIGAIIASESGWISRDRRGNIVATGIVANELITVVIACDEPDLVITVFGERGRKR